MPHPLVALHDVTKAFGKNVVLRGVSFDLCAGEVHVLAGENGAGKSTLIKVLSGAHTDYDGRILLDGRDVRFRGPQDALRHGLCVIHQELSLVPSMSVADNLALGRERRGAFGVAFRQQREEARELLAGLGLDVDVRRPLGSFPIAVQQLIEIARALSIDARVIVMDEPTSALSEPEAERLFERISDLVQRGAGIVYITHRMPEIYRLADRITVLRDGVRVGTAEPSDLPRDRLLRWMIGREPRELFRRRGTQPGEVLLRAERLVRHLSFELREREVLGLAGLAGSGAQALLHALFGDRDGSGAVTLGGERLAQRSPQRALRAGIALLTSDRRASGIVPELDVVANMTLARLPHLAPRGFLSRRRETERALPLARRINLQAPGWDSPIRELSGGNQQKALLVRWLLTEPRVLLLDEPTRGVDVGAKADVYAAIREIVDGGAAAILASSDMDELLGLCDRILVLHAGELVDVIDQADATAERILHAAMGGGAA